MGQRALPPSTNMHRANKGQHRWTNRLHYQHVQDSSHYFETSLFTNRCNTHYGINDQDEYPTRAIDSKPVAGGCVSDKWRHDAFAASRRPSDRPTKCATIFEQHLGPFTWLEGPNKAASCYSWPAKLPSRPVRRSPTSCGSCPGPGPATSPRPHAWSPRAATIHSNRSAAPANADAPVSCDGQSLPVPPPEEVELLFSDAKLIWDWNFDTFTVPTTSLRTSNTAGVESTTCTEDEPWCRLKLSLSTRDALLYMVYRRFVPTDNSPSFPVAVGSHDCKRCHDCALDRCSKFWPRSGRDSLRFAFGTAGSSVATNPRPFSIDIGGYASCGRLLRHLLVVWILRSKPSGQSFSSKCDRVPSQVHALATIYREGIAQEASGSYLHIDNAMVNLSCSVCRTMERSQRGRMARCQRLSRHAEFPPTSDGRPPRRALRRTRLGGWSGRPGQGRSFERLNSVPLEVAFGDLRTSRHPDPVVTTLPSHLSYQSSAARKLEEVPWPPRRSCRNGVHPQLGYDARGKGIRLSSRADTSMCAKDVPGHFDHYPGRCCLLRHTCALGVWETGRSGVGRRSFGLHIDSVALKAYCAKSMLYTATIGAATGDTSIIWLDGADEARTQMFREHNQGVPSVRIGPRSDSRESIPLCELDQVLRAGAHILRNNLVPDGDDMPALPSVARGLEKKLLELASLSKRKRGGEEAL
ncbi:hypothetical protein VFPBJ_11207 [Purpureocillium lilacinum]|uniref:Uncharacterized protein n=1 Tax=Purpureocillium lilacinum TaxID=33203 RepID=A0A179FJL2_PURLI|nr:hypothetical protein VFPBJ_11207 [Purpureocillium lilacinum]